MDQLDFINKFVKLQPKTYAETLLMSLLNAIGEEQIIASGFINDLYKYLHKLNVKSICRFKDGKLIVIMDTDSDVEAALYFVCRYIDLWIVSKQMFLKRCTYCHKWYVKNSFSNRMLYCCSSCKQKAGRKRKRDENRKNNNK